MPDRSKGARLWLRPARVRRNGYRESAVWVIRDGTRQISTGCGRGEIAEAERRLADFIAGKHRPERFRGGDPLAAGIADVIALYAEDVAPGHARPAETITRLERLLAYFGDKTLASLDASACRSYARAKGAQAAARRELEDLRAAIGHYFSGRLLGVKINLWLPDKSPPRETWYTRDQIALLLRTAWRKKAHTGNGGERHIWRHAARFILMGVYTGTRAETICRTAIRPTVGSPFVDVATGRYRRRPDGEKETTKRRPPVPLPRRLLAHLRRWERLGICRTHVVEWEGVPVKRVTKAFARLVEECGLDGSPHVLRHTAITWAMQGGAEIEQAQEFFGVTPAEMRRTYLHHHPDYMDGVLAAIDRR